MSDAALFTLWGALSIAFYGYVILSLALKFLPMEPGMRRIYRVAWNAVKWPALLYVPFSIITEINLGDSVDPLSYAICGANLVAWWWLHKAGDRLAVGSA